MRLKEKFSMLFNIPTLVSVVLIIGLIILAILTFGKKEEDDTIVPTVQPTPTGIAAPVNTPTPKPEINYGDKGNSGGGHKVDVDPTDKTPVKQKQESMYDREFDSEKYVTYEDGKIIFDFDAYTKDAITGDSEESEN